MTVVVDGCQVQRPHLVPICCVQVHIMADYVLQLAGMNDAADGAGLIQSVCLLLQAANMTGRLCKRICRNLAP